METKAHEFQFDALTPSEQSAFNELKSKGVKIYAAPIEIAKDKDDRRQQLQSLGITHEQCRTWRIGTEQVLVHLTPSDEETYRFLLNELRRKHRNSYRESRCQVPGTLKPLIRCPDSLQIWHFLQ